MWYAAHAVMLIRLKSGEPIKSDGQTEIPVWENIFLVEAATDKEAMAKARLRALDDENAADDTMLWGDEPSEFKFVGLRKLMLCFSDEEQPGDGTEITHNKLYFADQKQLDNFVAGEEAQLTIEDEFPDEPAADLNDEAAN